MALIISGLVSMARICGFYWTIWLSMGLLLIMLFMNSGFCSICYTIGFDIIWLII